MAVPYVCCPLQEQAGGAVRSGWMQMEPMTASTNDDPGALSDGAIARLVTGDPSALAKCFRAVQEIFLRVRERAGDRRRRFLQGRPLRAGLRRSRRAAGEIPPRGARAAAHAPKSWSSREATCLPRSSGG